MGAAGAKSGAAGVTGAATWIGGAGGGALLRVENLNVSFKTEDGVVCVVSGVGFSIARGEVLALVGESGSGKSVTALSLLRLLASPPASVSADAIEFSYGGERSDGGNGRHENSGERRESGGERHECSGERHENSGDLSGNGNGDSRGGSKRRRGGIGSVGGGTGIAGTGGAKPGGPLTADLSSCPDEQLRKIRGNRISMIFQEPMTSLNPTLTIGRQVTEALRLHMGMSRAAANSAAAGLLAEAGIPEPARQLKAYPHQLSGGMRQRVMIAMALSCRPDLLIADESTTALDVTIQVQIIKLMNDLRRKNNMAVLLITHNMGIVAEMADSVAVMYAGQIVEAGSCREVFTDTLHPYTKGLLESVPSLTGEKRKLAAIPGAVPSPRAWPDGCRFHPRCAFCSDGCRNAEAAPALREIAPGHFARCHRCAGTEGGERDG
jgi:peptide/nickel transport system ATP-binding protein/oligopeptide transport system ATP-binding protein